MRRLADVHLFVIVHYSCSHLVGLDPVLRDRQDVQQLRALLADGPGPGGVPHHVSQHPHQHRQHYWQARGCAGTAGSFTGMYWTLCWNLRRILLLSMYGYLNHDCCDELDTYISNSFYILSKRVQTVKLSPGTTLPSLVRYLMQSSCKSWIHGSCSCGNETWELSRLQHHCTK